MIRGFFANLIFAIIARMLCGNHLNCFFFSAKGGFATKLWANKVIDYKFLFLKP